MLLLQGKSAGGGQVVSFEMGSFVLIEGPDDSCWVAQVRRRIHVL